MYYQVAVLEESRDSLGNAIVNYKKSLRAKNGSPKQKTYSYEKLADIYFKGLSYVKASSYYDSVLVVAQNKQTLRIKKIERKAKNLAALSKNEKILQVNDSILSLVALPKESREKYFQDYIEKIKKEDEEKAQRKLNSISFGNSFGGGTQSTSNKGKWYFYNNQTVSFGKTEFGRIWGSRPLEDNWRWSDKTVIKSANKDDVTITQKPLRYEISTYLKGIPTEQEDINVLVSERNQALFELGLIYKEQFKNIPKAIGNLERLLKSKPKEELVLPASYHLYQIYLEKGDKKSDQYKNVILGEYADTPFAQIIINPEKELQKEDVVDEISDLYSIAYRLYKDNSFEETVCFVEMSIPTIENSIFIPRFELLKAYAIGKYQNKKRYLSALEKIAVGYPQTEQGKKALEIIDRLKKQSPDETK